MTVLRKWWYTMGPKRLQNHLTQNLKLPPDMVASIRERIAQERQEQRKTGIKQTVVYKAWQSVLASARAEAGVVRVLKYQHKKKTPNDEARWHALCAYEACIVRTIDRLKRVQSAGEHNPAQFVEFLKKTTGRVIPNGGAFWVDYVKLSERRQIEELFDALPPPVRGKKKAPFERRIPTAMHKAQRKALAEQMERAEETLYRELAVGPEVDYANKLKAQLHDVHHAKYLLEQMPKNALLPIKWQSLLG